MDFWYYFEWSPPWHMILTSIWRFIWRSIWHVFWQSIWHLVWHSTLSGSLTFCDLCVGSRRVSQHPELAEKETLTWKMGNKVFSKHLQWVSHWETWKVALRKPKASGSGMFRMVFLQFWDCPCHQLGPEKKENIGSCVQMRVTTRGMSVPAGNNVVYHGCLKRPFGRFTTCSFPSHQSSPKIEMTYFGEIWGSSIWETLTKILEQLYLRPKT